jgi:polar amino acid transport system ATP-binding protein
LQHLEVSDLCTSYGSVKVLSGVTFSLNKGEIVCLVGPSGSGKSTVLRTLIGLTPPASGRVMIDGTPIQYASKASIRRARERVAIVFQQYNLFQNMTTLRNVTIAPVKIKRWPRDEVERNAKSILAKVGLGDKLGAYPDQLSGGQQQRVAIARALCLRPEILLLDEVTSALDPELVTEVLDTIRTLAKDGMTMLIVSHEMAFVREVASRVIMMDQGRVIEQGPAREIIDAPKTERGREFFGKILRH